MATDMGRGIIAPDSSDNISISGVQEMRTIAATTAAAIGPIADEYVAGDGIRKIITSPNPELGLLPGELLLVTETLKWFADFHETPVGEEPVNMVNQWDGRYARTVVADDTALGGKLLRLDTDVAAYRWLTIPDPSDLTSVSLDDPRAMDLVVRWRADQVTAAPRLAVWGQGHPSTDDRQAFHSILRTNGQISAGYIYEGNRGGTLEGNSRAFTPNFWYITRVRMAHSRSAGAMQFSVKMWSAYAPEPAGWSFRTTAHLADMKQSGWAGIYFRGPGTADIDWIGASWDTGKAPSPEVM